MKFLDLAFLPPLLLLGIGLFLKNSRSGSQAEQSEQPETEDLRVKPLTHPLELIAMPAQVQLNAVSDALMGEQREMEADIVADGQQSDMDAPETQVAEAPKTEIGTKTEIETEIANLTDTDSTVTSRTEEIAGIDSSEPTELSEISMPIGLDLNDTNPQDLDIGDMNAANPDSVDLDPVNLESPEPPILPLIPLGDPVLGIEIEEFKQAFSTNLLRRGKSVETATTAECYDILAEMVRDRLLQTHRELTRPTSSRLVIEIAPEFSLGLPLENHFTNLSMTQPIYQGLSDLGLDFVQICQHDQLQGRGDEGVGCILGSYLESLATAQIPAIGYGLHPMLESPTDSAINSAINSEINSEINSDTASPWELRQPDQSLDVKFGGHTEIYVDQYGHCRRGWMAAEVARAVPSDLPVSGYLAQSVSLLRLWQVSPAISPLAGSDPAELKLRQDFLLVSCAVQDVIRRHLAADLPLGSLPDHWVLQLNDTATVLTIAELMHQLVDQHGSDWEQAWAMTESMLSCTFHDLVNDQRGDYSLALLHRLLPRHLEIIHEINRRFLDAVRFSSTRPDEARIGRLSLVDQDWLRSSHLAAVGSYSLSGSGLFHTQWLQNELLADLSQVYPTKFQPKSAGITARRFLLQTHPALVNLITQWLSDDWLLQPDQLRRLEPLVNDSEFCGHWWQVRRDAKQVLANKIQQSIGLTVNLSTLFDIQAGSMQPSSRQLLHLLHVITLYARIKVNSSTDTIQRFTHRSVPRTCIFVGQPAADPISQLTARLIRAVAATINQDSDLQGRLQVAFLEESSPKLLRWVYPAADLAEHLSLAGQAGLDVTSLKFAINGAVTIGMPSYSNVELRQAVGAKNIFLAGMTATEAQHCRVNYHPQERYSSDPDLKQAIDLIASGYFSHGDGSPFRPLIDWLLNEDPDLILADYSAYIAAQERVSQVCQDQKIWVWMSILTVANIGQFFSDHAIADYQTIWQIPTEA